MPVNTRTILILSTTSYYGFKTSRSTLIALLLCYGQIQRVCVCVKCDNVLFKHFDLIVLLP